MAKLMKKYDKISWVITGLTFILFIPNILQWTNDIIKNLNELTQLPEPLKGYFPFVIFSIGVCSSILGGAIWGFIWKSIGDKREPHGIQAIYWSIVTNIPTTVFFIGIGRKVFGIPFSTLSVLSIASLIGFSFGSWFFYSFPFKKNGFRNLIEGIVSEKFKRKDLFWSEFILALIWSLSLSIPAFAFYQLASFMLHKLDIVMYFNSFLNQIAFVVGAICIIVWSFIIVYPSIRKHAMARGLIAGIVLRTAFFMALFISFNQTNSI